MCVPGLGTEGRPTGLPPAKTTQNLMNNFLGQTTDANGNTPNAMGPVMANAADDPGGRLRGMPMKRVQAEADPCIVPDEAVDSRPARGRPDAEDA